MSCPRCDADLVAFVVPPAIREHAPAATTAICTRCLRTFAADGSDGGVEVDGSDSASPADPDFSAVDSAFPDGEAGAALALVCGKLESFALNRASIEALVDHAERSGADVFAFLERLDAADAAFDLDRRRAALLDVL
ncbi:hypothetical protein DJ82_06140 [Halorubrum sp. Ib24]|uniref:DUF6276 family protein n=1 Tax=unclassified Halorubrum TaxID=2642239 RepID=UPI000B987430|nr:MULTISPECIES: DUF6276 family protein [unclassified Halorubrum]OYR40879.1 hypothetical protein DJ81_13450 [Halorubrum sp. Hd13]OYR41087.1 hypothetical protein DJ82_06140 [Halorubrum sp. Ib24]OYR49451.1 hypothetical protein DJ74_08395 [Halorubrum sp. Ea8]OYR54949.1 hypothetical protein DJ73_03715 [Halorubrum sp. Ea1]